MISRVALTQTFPSKINARKPLLRFRTVSARAEPDAEPSKPTPPSDDVVVDTVAEEVKPVEEPTPAPVKEPVKLEAAEPEEAYTLKVTGERFKVAEGQLAAIVGASPGLALRAGTGAVVAGYSASIGAQDASLYTLQSFGERALKETSTAIPGFNRPEKPIVIYEFDACPFCKKVREMVNYLDIDVLFYPCPKDGPNFRPEAMKKGGKSQFPYMEDPNTGEAMYESDAIIEYLAKTYGDGSVPATLKLGPLTVITCGLSAVGRIGKGSQYSPSTLPEQPLVLWGYEPSPFTRVVRERITELEIPHLFRTCARGSEKRQEMFDKYGKFQAPLVEDPNTKVALFESAEIVKYLDETYGGSGAAPQQAAPAEPAAASV